MLTVLSTAMAQRSAKSTSRLANSIKIHGQIQMGLGQKVCARTTRLPRLERISPAAPAAYSSSISLAVVPKEAPQTRTINSAGKTHQLGASIIALACTETFVPFDAVEHNGRDVIEGFHIVDARRLTPRTDKRGKWWLCPGIGSPSFKRVDKRAVSSPQI